MKERNQSLFILAGNGPYENRGCEAITRGTVKMLKEFYEDPSFVAISHFQNDGQFQSQKNSEHDLAIRHLQSRLPHRRFDSEWWRAKVYRTLGLQLTPDHIYGPMLPSLPDARAVLSVGGDNYSLDYGIPRIFTDLDDLVLRKGKPIIIWGASVGPFSKMPEYEKFMVQHLKSVTAIFARETGTVEYLDSIGVRDNVSLMVDPAFFMEAAEPQDDQKPCILPGTIGLNLSPLMAGYVTDGNIPEWIKLSTNILTRIREKTGRPVYLIPHVVSPHDNDHRFLQEVVNAYGAKDPEVQLLPATFNAAQTKWIISQCDVIAAARTHATIAGFSSKIPTVSFAYSLKAQGLNRDIFGNVDKYLLNPKAITSEAAVEKIELALRETQEIKKALGKYLAEAINKKSFLSEKLKDLI